MKQVVLLAGLLLPATLSAAQKLLPAQVPAPVQLAFQQAQPQAAHVSWHRCPAGYEAAFAQRPAERVVGERILWGQVALTPTGQVVETRLDVAYRTFPPLGRTALNQQYPHRELDRIIRIVDAQGGVHYEVKICKGKNKSGKDKNCQTSCFDEDGRPLPGMGA